MALEKVRDLLDDAKKANTTVIAFDACDYNTIYACIKGAEAARRPVIVMLYPTMRSVFSFGAFAATVKDLARDASVPVGLHLDHCSDLPTIVEAIRDGFTSVMADGSAMPLEENIAFTKSVVDIAKIFDVDVEGEIGHVGQVAGGFDYQNADTFTRPDEAATFAERTGVTSLAVAFGSCHGMYKAAPNLDLERLVEIDRAVEAPLVLHGGSGIPTDQLEKAFRMGIHKFNVGTEFFLLNTKLCREAYTSDEILKNPLAGITSVRKGLVEYVAKKLELCEIKYEANGNGEDV